MARLLAGAQQEALDVPRMFCFCAALTAGLRTAAIARATGEAGDVYICHPLLMHSASTSVTGHAPRCILNIPHPYVGARLREGSGHRVSAR